MTKFTDHELATVLAGLRLWDDMAAMIAKELAA